MDGDTSRKVNVRLSLPLAFPLPPLYQSSLSVIKICAWEKYHSMASLEVEADDSIARPLEGQGG